MVQPTLNPESGFRRLKIDLSYDGTNFAGWAKQPDQRTIQEEIEDALSRITRHKVSTIVAGRTDAGVHALHQIIHVDIPAVPHVSRYRQMKLSGILKISTSASIKSLVQIFASTPLLKLLQTSMPDFLRRHVTIATRFSTIIVCFRHFSGSMPQPGLESSILI